MFVGMMRAVAAPAGDPDAPQLRQPLLACAGAGALPASNQQQQWQQQPATDSVTAAAPGFASLDQPLVAENPDGSVFMMVATHRPGCSAQVRPEGQAGAEQEAGAGQAPTGAACEVYVLQGHAGSGGAQDPQAAARAELRRAEEERVRAWDAEMTAEEAAIEMQVGGAGALGQHWFLWCRGKRLLGAWRGGGCVAWKGQAGAWGCAAGLVGVCVCHATSWASLPGHARRTIGWIIVM